MCLRNALRLYSLFYTVEPNGIGSKTFAAAKVLQFFELCKFPDKNIKKTAKNAGRPGVK